MAPGCFGWSDAASWGYHPETMRWRERRRRLGSILALLTLLCGLSVAALGGCDEPDCEEKCVGDNERWYDDCEQCADGALFESECAEIWCE